MGLLVYGSFSITLQSTLLLHVLFIFFASPKKTNQKKRAFFLGIFALPGKTARSPLNFLQGFENF